MLFLLLEWASVALSLDLLCLEWVVTSNTIPRCEAKSLMKENTLSFHWKGHSNKQNKHIYSWTQSNNHTVEVAFFTCQLCV